MKIAICDDDNIYLEDAEKHIKQYFTERSKSYELFKFDSSEGILNSNKDFNIAILDIEMNGANGIEIGKELRKANPEIILIYLTAYNHYLDNALDLGITRYFDKPIDSKRFFDGLDSAIEKIDDSQVSFYVKDDNKGMRSVAYKDIIYIEILERKTRVVTTKGEFLSVNNMNYWKEQLTKPYFEIPHHSFVINSNFVTYYHHDFLIMNDDENIPIAYSKRKTFKEKFVKNTEI